MGLISKEVEVKLSGKSIKHYENLGYEIPRILNKDNKLVVPRGTKIIVKIEDIHPKSATAISVQCDGKCGEIKEMRYHDYKRKVRENGTYYCRKCVKVFTTDKMIKTKLENSKSFEQWCIENSQQDILDRWNYELNNCKPSEVSYCSSKLFYFRCPRDLHSSELKRIHDFITGESSLKCKQCNSFAQWGIDNICEDFLEKYWDYEKNILNPFFITFSGNTKVWIKCLEKDYHESNPIRCGDFTLKNVRCPLCSNSTGRVHKLDSLGTLYPEVFDVWSDKNEKSPYDYSPMSHSKVWWKCPNGTHEDFKRTIKDSNNYDFRCSKCSKERNESFLQEKVRLYINSLNYTILHERDCNIVAHNPKVKNKLGRMPYDNEIQELKLIIEVHGKQHYIITNYAVMTAKNKNTTPEYEIHIIKLHDRYKRIFAKRRGYFYLEIPYWTDDKEETWKKLINEKIQELKRISNE